MRSSKNRSTKKTRSPKKPEIWPGLFKQFPNEMILALNRDDPARHDAYHLDLTTHESGGITERDLGLAGMIQALIPV